MLFSFLWVLLSLPFLAVLIGLGGGGFPCQSLINVHPSHPLHLCLHLPLPPQHNLSTRNALLSLSILCHVCLPCSPLFLFISLLRTIFVLLVYLSLFLYLLHSTFIIHIHLSLFHSLSIFHIPLLYPKVFLLVTHIHT